VTNLFGHPPQSDGRDLKSITDQPVILVKNHILFSFISIVIVCGMHIKHLDITGLQI